MPHSNVFSSGKEVLILDNILVSCIQELIIGMSQWVQFPDSYIYIYIYIYGQAWASDVSNIIFLIIVYHHFCAVFVYNSMILLVLFVIPMFYKIWSSHWRHCCNISFTTNNNGTKFFNEDLYIKHRNKTWLWMVPGKLMRSIHCLMCVFMQYWLNWFCYRRVLKYEITRLESNTYFVHSNIAIHVSYLSFSLTPARNHDIPTPKPQHCVHVS